MVFLFFLRVWQNMTAALTPKLWADLARSFRIKSMSIQRSFKAKKIENLDVCIFRRAEYYKSNNFVVHP